MLACTDAATHSGVRDVDLGMDTPTAEGTSVSSLLAAESAPKGGSRPDTSDMTTTNVCVTNLPAEVPEAALGRFFSRWGDVGTAKAST